MGPLTLELEQSKVDLDASLAHSKTLESQLAEVTREHAASSDRVQSLLAETSYLAEALESAGGQRQLEAETAPAKGLASSSEDHVEELRKATSETQRLKGELHTRENE